MRDSAETLLVILNDILDFSKIEAGGLSLEEEDFDLREVIEDTLELLAEGAHSKGLELAGLLQPNTPTHLRGDSGRIRQILTNLLSNAIKFTKSGEVVVYVAEERRDCHHLTMRFQVLDTGIGIATKAQSQLFQDFAQAEGSTTRKYGGTGLGLAISKRLVELMDGEIGLESELSRGSLFWFTVQLKHPVASISLKQRRADCLRDLKVLVVDDNRTNGRILHYQLSALGLRDDYASSGEEALRLLRAAAASNTPYSLAILDMQMPVMGGLALARIMQSDPTLIQHPKNHADIAGPPAAKSRPARCWDFRMPIQAGEGGKALRLSHSHHGRSLPELQKDGSLPATRELRRPRSSAFMARCEYFWPKTTRCTKNSCFSSWENSAIELISPSMGCRS